MRFTELALRGAFVVAPERREDARGWFARTFCRDEFAAHGVDRREIRKLKRGEYPVAGRHDLHGMTADAARASVQRFLETSSHKHHRCVCIVHGRGLRSPGGVAVLKARVRDYLRTHRRVLAFADAPRSDGGSGAVYVLLRR